ncbi:hypothetical protein L873DRAFT_363534 [Choiromyces venosus 120613-1]|uniref:Protein kinase domain-containing protein n=1 Tax=Choiromyces venosus 120613-1 TaxID=1336337 RepID=A0A3N4JWJ1_9PEZI|nr:hypothetical protein L873DRAFT_363534 [Choiromyces venosus 120613-1]
MPRYSTRSVQESEEEEEEDKGEEEDIEEGKNNGQDEETEARGGVIKNSFRGAGRKQSTEIGMLEVRTQPSPSASQDRGKYSQRPWYQQKKRKLYTFGAAARIADYEAQRCLVHSRLRWFFAIATEIAGSPIVVQGLRDQEHNKMVKALLDIHTYGVIHKDICPADIFIQCRHNGFKVIFIDFSFLKRVSNKAEYKKEIATLKIMLGIYLNVKNRKLKKPRLT